MMVDNGNFILFVMKSFVVSIKCIKFLVFVGFNGILKRIDNLGLI